MKLIGNRKELHKLFDKANIKPKANVISSMVISIITKNILLVLDHCVDDEISNKIKTELENEFEKW